MNRLSKILFILIFTSVYMSAHTFWVNAIESKNYSPSSASVSLGWGHNTPIDDMLNSYNGKITVKEFTLNSPSFEKINLRVPLSALAKAQQKTKNFDVYDYDIALQKIAFNKKSKEGVYRLEAKSEENYLLKYIDTKNRTRLKFTSMDKAKNVQSVLSSIQTKRTARAYITLGKWKKIKPLNEGLELIALNDLSKVKVGDLLKFDVLFYGKKIKDNAKMEYISASSNTFGQKDKFSLLSYIVDGKAQIRVQSKGQWLISTTHKEAVENNGALKHLKNKVKYIEETTTLTFMVN